VTEQQPDVPSEDVAADTTASLDHDALAARLDPAQPDPDRDDARALVITRGPGAGSRYRIVDDEIRIGRHPDAHVLLDDVTVSRRHALLTTVDGRVILADQASLNGTYVAGERVESHVLTDGDEVQIGRFHLVFLEGPSAVPDVRHDG
jgi:pSer/pThr/pTyr-binding forkhead associated (FHA) protein